MQPEHFAAGNAGRFQALQQHFARPNIQFTLNFDHQQIAITAAPQIRLESIVVGNVRALNDLTGKAFELRVVADGNDQWAVLRIEHAIGNNGRMRIAVTRRILLHQHRFQPVIGGNHQATIEQRHLDMPAGPG